MSMAMKFRDWACSADHQYYGRVGHGFPDLPLVAVDRAVDTSPLTK